MKGINVFRASFPARKKSPLAKVSAGLDLIIWKTGRLVKTAAITGWCRPHRRRSVQKFLLAVRLCAYVPVAQL